MLIQKKTKSLYESGKENLAEARKRSRREGGREGGGERKRLLYKIKHSLKFLEKSERRNFHSVPNMISKKS